MDIPYNTLQFPESHKFLLRKLILRLVINEKSHGSQSLNCESFVIIHLYRSSVTEMINGKEYVYIYLWLKLMFHVSISIAL
jgi:hypothetical protein